MSCRIVQRQNRGSTRVVLPDSNCLNKSERASLIRLIYEEIDALRAPGDWYSRVRDILDLSNLQEMTPSADVILDTIVAAPAERRGVPGLRFLKPCLTD